MSQANYKATLREKDQLLQVVKDLQVKINDLQEKQAAELRNSWVKSFQSTLVPKSFRCIMSFLSDMFGVKRS